jgi:uncharacterized protein (TIGR03086 family)
MNECDLSTAAAAMAELIRNISDDQLNGPTPCPEYSIGDLVDHVGGFAMAFTWAANKEAPPGGAQGPSGDASRLTDNWRRGIPADLAKLAAAWKQPEAWTGMTQAGGIDLPGEIAGAVALDELVIHGWDVARATSQPYDVDSQSLDAVANFVQGFSPDGTPGMFGPRVPVPDTAPLLDRVIGMAGRDPNWSPRAAQRRAGSKSSTTLRDG